MAITHKLSTQKSDGKKSKNYAGSYRKTNPNLAKFVKAYTFQWFIRHILDKFLLHSLSYSRNGIMRTNAEVNSALIL